MRLRGGALTLVLLLLAGSTAQAAPVGSRASDLLSRLPVRVEPNRGQLPEGVRLGARAGDGEAFLRDDGIVLAPAGLAAAGRVHLRLPDGRSIRPEPAGLLPGVRNVVVGADPARWVLGVPGFEAAVYRDLAAGVDLAFHGRRHTLEIELILAPAAVLPPAVLEIEGATGIRLEADGRLTLLYGRGEIALLPPFAFQESALGRVEIPARYRISPPCGLGVELGPHDAASPVVVDPVIVFSTPLGGSGVDEAHALAVSADGTTTIAGYTASADFPITAGGTPAKTNGDAFVVRLDAAHQLVFATTIGGSGWERADGVAVDPSGNTILAGDTTSPDFPTTASAFQRTYGGHPTGSQPEPTGDAWAAKLGPTGIPLWVTYLGGSRGDDVDAVATDAQGNAYLLGNTSSRNFPVTAGALQTTRAGSSDYNTDAFVTKIDASGTRLSWSTFLGGTGIEGGYFYGLGGGIGVSASGEATVCGTAGSGFPTTAGAYQTSIRGSSDAFVARLDANGSRLLWSTFLGGSGIETPWGLAFDPTGPILLMGSTSSVDFPVTPGASQTTYGGGYYDLFVAKLSASGSSLLWATYLGGAGDECDRLDTPFGAIAADPQGGAWVAGNTDSPDFPTTAGAIQPTPARGILYSAPVNGGAFSLPVKSPPGNAVKAILDAVTNPLVLWALLDQALVRTDDGGKTWKSVTPPALPGQVPQTIAQDAIASGVIYAGLSFGSGTNPRSVVYRTSNGGDSWTAASTGLPSSASPFSLAVDVRRSGTVYLASTGGFFRTTNSGSQWVPAGSGLVMTPQLLFYNSYGQGTLWATDGMKLQKSVDGGATFQPPVQGLPETYGIRLAFDPAVDKTWAATSYGIFESTNGGQSWVERNNGIPTTHRSIPAIDAHPSRAGLAWAVSSVGGAYATTDGGLTWTPVSGPLTGYSSILNVSQTLVWLGCKGSLDDFVAHYSPLGERLFSTYLGGTNDERARGIVLDGGGRVHVAGSTTSFNFPFVGALQAFRGSDAFLALLGDGPSPSVTPSALDFGRVGVGASVERTLTVRNAGTGTLTGTVTSAEPFGVVSGAALSLAAGAQQQVVLRFRPSTVGAASGTARVETNGGTATVGLSGTGETPTGPALSASPSAADFGELVVGATAERTVTVRNAGTGTLTGTAATNAPWAVVSGASFSLAAGSSSPVVVRFSPSGGGTFAGSLRLESNGGSRTVSLSGKATEVGITRFVPIVLVAAGKSDSYFTSELTLVNGGAAATDIDLVYTAAYGGGSGVARDTLRAGQQKVVPNAIEYLRERGLAIPATGNRGGTLAVRFRSVPSAEACAALVRTATAVPDGRAGLAYAGLTREALLSGPILLTGLRQTDQDRSNVALMNAGTSAEGWVSLRVTVRSGDPASPVSKTLTDIPIPPGGFTQIDAILGSNGLSLTNGWVTVERVAGAAPWYAYAVVNDQLSSDGSFVAPVASSSGRGKTRRTLPVIVEAGKFTSELVATNVSASRRSVELRFVADAVTAPGNEARTSLDLAAGEQRVIPSFVQYLRQRSVAGIGPAGTTYAGALFVHATGGDSADVHVSARTAAAGAKGRYGLFYAASPDGEAATATAWLHGIRQDAENRTNLAFVNTGENGESTVVLRVEIFDGDTGALAAVKEGEGIGPRRWKQVGTVLSQWAPGVKNGRIRLTRTAGTNPFLAYAVVNDGAASDQRSGDGAFVPMAFTAVALVPTIEVSPSSIDFGTVAVGTSKDVSLTVRNTGTATLTVSSVSVLGDPFAAPGISVPFSLSPGGTRTVALRFTPPGSVAYGGTVSVASNDAAHPSVLVPLSGRGTAPVNEELSTDDGSVESGVVQGGLVIVNRLTPGGYPATLRTIRLYVAHYSDLPNPSGSQVRLLVFTDQAGTGSPPRLPPVLLDKVVSLPTVAAPGAWVDFTVTGASPLASGDLYVGFGLPSPAGGVGFAVDENGTPRNRGFFSTDGGLTFQGPLVVTSGSVQREANIMIRAVVSRP